MIVLAIVMGALAVITMGVITMGIYGMTAEALDNFVGDSWKGRWYRTPVILGLAAIPAVAFVWFIIAKYVI